MSSLFLFNFSGARFGVWADAVSSVQRAKPLRRLPLSPACIAGVVILDERGVTIADLAACLGRPAITRRRKGTFLVIDPDENIAGFCVEGAFERIECAPGEVLPLPAPVRTAIADTCVVRDGVLIPIVDIGNLRDRLKQGVFELPAPEWKASAADAGLPADGAVRAFSLGGARFCVKAEGTGHAAITAELIAALPLASSFVAGIALQENVPVPVLYLGARLGVGMRGALKDMLLADIDGRRCGFPVDEGLGVLQGPDLRMLPLPALARLPWVRAAAVNGGNIYPLVDLAALLAAGEGVAEPAQFATSSSFISLFRKREARLVEFSLLGAVHALPKEEVKDVRPLLPIAPLPHAPEIVLGVSEAEGELLPVLDLAAVFGRRTPLGNGGRMMLVENGDFRAFVVTDRVVGERRLPADMQRQVPIALPLNVVYGCYLDAGTVNLIMNVEALAVHFEKAAVRELVAGLAPAMTERAVDVASFKTASEESAVKEEAVREPRSEETVEAAAHEQPAVAAVPVRAEAPVEEKAPRDAEEARAREEEKLKEAAEKSRAAEEELRARAALEARLQVEAEAGEKADQERRRREAEKKAEEEARIAAEALVKEREETRGKAAREAMLRQEEERRKAGEAARAEAAAEQAVAAMDREEFREPAVGKRIEQARPAVGRQEAAGPLTPLRQSSLPGGNRFALPAAVAAVLALGIYFTGTFMRQHGVSVAEKEHPPAAPQPSSQQYPPLYLRVPPTKPIPDPTIYTVVKGDTLWGIAERFTGNPLDYPRVAADNSIATPDLIFPGQRIKLIREQY